MSKSGSPSRKTIETAVSFKMLIFILYFRYLYPYSSCFIGFSLCVKQVNLVLDDGRSLGLMIRGGAEYALGIYITGVDQGSAAECGGLKVLLQFHFSLTFLHVHCLSNLCLAAQLLILWNSHEKISQLFEIILVCSSPTRFSCQKHLLYAKSLIILLYSASHCIDFAI